MCNIFTIINVQGIIICNSPKLEIAQIPTNSRIE